MDEVIHRAADPTSGSGGQGSSEWVFLFGGHSSQGKPGSANLLGGKGANLWEMASIGLPVPPGFTISTDVCRFYYQNGRNYPAGLSDQVLEGIGHVEGITGKRFGCAKNPLLVSVRSGARISMPGMMDTVLNLGLNDQTVIGLAAASGDQRFAWDSYRRFIQMYSEVVLELDGAAFSQILDFAKKQRGYAHDTEMTAEDLKALVHMYQNLVRDISGSPFPQDVRDQLWGAVGAVFGSWQSDRAKVYRRLNDIATEWGTAVNVQAMVFGNMGDTSATGVAFTRNPSTGDSSYYGEFLLNAQGEDVVAGILTPHFLTQSARELAASDRPSMEEVLPEAYARLAQVFDQLEKHYRDMQDIEFTVEDGKLWILQTRSGKRTARAAVKIAVEMANEGLITREEAITRVDPSMLDQLLHRTIDPNAPREVLTKGLPASPGAACGKVVFDANFAEQRAAAGEAVILVRSETSPKDIHGMYAAKGIVTATGGMTSHAAVVARGMGRPCVSGAGEISIDATARVMRVGAREIKEGDLITMDGSSGELMLGEVATAHSDLADDFKTLMGWADKVRRLKVRANADTPNDARAARGFGAEGIGLCRTEHMFFDGGRIAAVRQMILAEDEEGRRVALQKLLPAQRSDFVEILEVMAGLPVTIRLLDPPLHEFLPKDDADCAEVAAAAGVDVDYVKRRAAELHEFNPMLGHRGCRLGITYPEIYETQARAIFEAACIVADRSGDAPSLEIMIPLIATRRELEMMNSLVDQVAREVFAERKRAVKYTVGTMIELPRAALRAGEIAEVGRFFSFGTNDLTQTVLGISRDDARGFLARYAQEQIYPKNPFVSLDVEGVGELMKIAVDRGRKTRHDIKLGICGEHGGDPASIMFCETIGLDYVSASPFRIPAARLAAAQATLTRYGELQSFSSN